MFEKWPDGMLLAALIWGESRGETTPGQIAIANVVKNRVMKGGWWGNTWREVMLKPYQFSCFNQDDPNFKKMERLTANKLRVELWVALGVMLGDLSDNTGGATHYFAYKTVRPQWADSLTTTAVYGNHLFMK